MSLIQRVLTNLEDRRQRILNGQINCIPSPFSSFRSDFPGVEKGLYYLVSGATKAAKTQIASFLFIYAPLLYAYNNPEKLRLKIFYFPLEETQEKITTRFMSHLLYLKYKIRIAPADLRSTNETKIVDKAVLEKLNTLEIRSLLDFFEDHVHFISERNPTGIWKTIKKYAEEAGTIHRKTIIIENKDTGIKQEREVFDYYEPKDPDEYVIVFIDHAGRLDQEKGFTKKENIDKLSEYLMVFRDRYGYSPVLVQQQNSDTVSLDAFKANKIRPTYNGLMDTKQTGQDCSVLIGITNPSAFELPDYLHYDITKLKGYVRFLEVVLNREGESNGVLALYFDGATNFFTPLPRYDDLPSLKKVYDLVQRNSQSRA